MTKISTPRYLFSVIFIVGISCVQAREQQLPPQSATYEWPKDQQVLQIGAYFSKPDWHCEYYRWPMYATAGRNVSYDIRKHPWLFHLRGLNKQA